MGLLPLIVACLLNNTTMEEIRAGIILKKDDRYLLVQNNLTGKWSFTKGHAETQDINLLETAQREVKEESGYMESIHYQIDSGPEFIGRTTYWFGTVHSGASPVLNPSGEQSGAGWFSRGEIRHLKKNYDVKAWLSY
jgi:8-oxo-dGTP pyrophosphatase MutT (NUDIX family)